MDSLRLQHGHELLLMEVMWDEPWCVDVHPSNGEGGVTSFRDDKVYISNGLTRAYSIPWRPASNVGVSSILQGQCSRDGELLRQGVCRRRRDAGSHQHDERLSKPRGIAWRPDGVRAWVSHLLIPKTVEDLRRCSRRPGRQANVGIIRSSQRTMAVIPRDAEHHTCTPPADTILWIPNNMLNSNACSCLKSAGADEYLPPRRFAP